MDNTYTEEHVMEGNSSDAEEPDCQVYANVNVLSPMQNVSAEGNDGDFPERLFEYTIEYKLIKDGENKLGKNKCSDNGPTSISQ